MPNTIHDITMAHLIAEKKLNLSEIHPDIREKVLFMLKHSKRYKQLSIQLANQSTTITSEDLASSLNTLCMDEPPTSAAEEEKKPQKSKKVSFFELKETTKDKEGELR
jgi:hypothetical protein